MFQNNLLTDARMQARAKDVNILIACEESQRETIAFRNLGFNAYSCDLQLCSGGHPEWHIIGDCRPYLQGKTTFQTLDFKHRRVSNWHMIIAHPPCTYLCKVSSVWLWVNGELDPIRLGKMKEAALFFNECLHALAPYVAVENPLPMKRAGLPQPSFFIDPSWFGVKYTKKTLFWTKNLPPIMPEIINPNATSFVRSSKGKYRSRTFEPVARAIALQWGSYLLDELCPI